MYLGPETLMPLASIAAAVTGVAVLFWRRTKGAARISYDFVRRVVSKIFSG